MERVIVEGSQAGGGANSGNGEEGKVSRAGAKGEKEEDRQGREPGVDMRHGTASFAQLIVASNEVMREGLCSLPNMRFSS